MVTQPHPVFGKYEILGQLGGGGFGQVLKARHRTLDDLRAIKRINQIVVDEVALRRFEREAQALMRLCKRQLHPHVVRLYDAHVEQGFPYIDMEFIDGSDLSALLRQGPLPIAEVERLACEMADALAWVHAHGIIHRDLKPGNILRRSEDGRFVLTDFGLAFATDTTRSMSGMGTPEYMSPEQIDGTETAATDVYSLGVVLFECLTGQVPFPVGGSHLSAMTRLEQRIRHEAAPPVDTLRPETPAWLVAFIARCLVKDPAQRFADGQALLAALPARPGATPASRGLTEEALRQQLQAAEQARTALETRLVELECRLAAPEMSPRNGQVAAPLPAPPVSPAAPPPVPVPQPPVEADPTTPPEAKVTADARTVLTPFLEPGEQVRHWAMGTGPSRLVRRLVIGTALALAVLVRVGWSQLPEGIQAPFDMLRDLLEAVWPSLFDPFGPVRVFDLVAVLLLFGGILYGLWGLTKGVRTRRYLLAATNRRLLVLYLRGGRHSPEEWKVRKLAHAYLLHTLPPIRTAKKKVVVLKVYDAYTPFEVHCGVFPEDPQYRRAAELATLLSSQQERSARLRP
jgi:serine/threonine protein kinase